MATTDPRPETLSPVSDAPETAAAPRETAVAPRETAVAPRETAVAPRAAAAPPAPGNPIAAHAAAAPRTPGAPRPPGAPAVAKQRPDPRPMRLGLAAGGLAAMSIMVAGLVRFPAPDPVTVADDAVQGGDTAVAAPRRVKVEKRIRYVHLKPGQKAPRGAKVIDAAQPAPRVVVTRIQAPAPRRVRVVTRTRQSGR